jgi:hypothetical protein
MVQSTWTSRNKRKRSCNKQKFVTLTRHAPRSAPRFVRLKPPGEYGWLSAKPRNQIRVLDSAERQC